MKDAHLTCINRMVARLDSVFVMDGAAELTRHERAEVTGLLEKTLYDIVGIVEPGMFVEVGAFDASFSCRMKARYPDARCLALEANPRVFERFRDEIQAKGVDYMLLAAAAESGNVDLYIPEVIAGNARPHVNRMASLNQIRAKNSTMVKTSVPAITLDKLLAPTSPERLCMWVDVEGAIDKVLEGAQRTLERTDVIYCEIEERQVWKDQVLAPAILTKLEMSGFVMVARDF